MNRAVIGLVLALAVTGIARFYIFRLQDKEIAADFYERRIQLDDLKLPEQKIPPGFRAVPGDPGTTPGLAEHSTPAAPGSRRPVFPSSDTISATSSAAYSSTLGERVVVVASQYATALAPEPPPTFRRWDGCLVTAVAPNPLLAETFLNSLSERVTTLKKDSVKLNKLKTIGNVLLKLFMDILVGTFGVMLALFLVKYFLILRRF